MTETIEAEVAEIDDHRVTFYHNEVNGDGLLSRILDFRERFVIPFPRNPGLSVGDTVLIDVHRKGGAE